MHYWPTWASRKGWRRRPETRNSVTPDLIRGPLAFFQNETTGNRKPNYTLRNVSSRLRVLLPRIPSLLMNSSGCQRHWCWLLSQKVWSEISVLWERDSSAPQASQEQNKQRNVLLSVTNFTICACGVEKRLTANLPHMLRIMLSVNNAFNLCKHVIRQVMSDFSSQSQGVAA